MFLFQNTYIFEEPNYYLITEQKRNTGIPRLTRFLWEPKNRVRRNSRYGSQSVEKNICKIAVPKLPCYPRDSFIL